MFEALYNFFLNNVFVYDNSLIDYMENINFNIGQIDVAFIDWLCITCSLISLIFIVVLCCLFIYRLIRLVGRLFSGGAL